MIKNRILFSLWCLLIFIYFLLYSDKIAVMLVAFTLLVSAAFFIVRKRNLINKLLSAGSGNEQKNNKKSDNKEDEKENKVKKNSVLNKFKNKEALGKLFLAILLMASAVLLFISAMGISCSLIPVLLIGAFFCFLIWLEWGRKTSVYSVILFVFGFILIGFIMKNQYALNSVLIFYNKLAEKLAMTGLRNPAQYVVEVAESSYPLYMTYLMSLFSAFAGLVGYTVVAHKQYIFLWIYSILMILLCFLGFSPAAIYVIFFIFITSLVLISNRLKVFSLSYVYVGATILVISLASLLIGESFGGFLQKFESPMEILVERINYKTNTVDSYGEGKIAGNSLYKADQTALRITMDNPKPMYLRGFIGAEFNGKRWLEAEPIIAYQNRELFNIFSNNGFNTYSQAAALNYFIDPEAVESQVNVEYIGAGNEYVFLPYELKALNTEDYVKIRGDLVKSNANNQLTYSFSMNGMLYQKAATISEDNKEKLIGVSFAEFDVCEENYDKFVSDNYLNVRENDRAVIEAVFERNEVDIESELSNSQAIECVKKVLNNELTYDESVKLSVFDRNSVYTLFNDLKKGYDIHYASLATLMFRTLGVPARYVEGYVVSITDSVKMKSNKPYNIFGSGAHAWTEIYVEDFGWMPVEVYEEAYNMMYPTTENTVKSKK